MANGKQISAELANDEINAYFTMMKDARTPIVEFCTEKVAEGAFVSVSNSSPHATPAVYFNKNANAFVFDSKLIKPFFETNGPDGRPQTPADVLIVFLAMVKDDDSLPENVGTPTVVLAGCFDQGDNTFRSMNLPGREAIQFPPKVIMPFFPERIDQMIQNISSLSDDSSKMANELKAEMTKHLPMIFKVIE